jgi:hypothetical protein
MLSSLICGIQTDSGAYSTSIHWLPGTFSPRLKRSGSDDEHLPASTAEAKNGVKPPLRTRLHDALHRDNGIHYQYKCQQNVFKVACGWI